MKKNYNADFIRRRLLQGSDYKWRDYKEALLTDMKSQIENIKFI